jgi:hypothetical protein
MSAHEKARADEWSEGSLVTGPTTKKARQPQGGAGSLRRVPHRLLLPQA